MILFPFVWRGNERAREVELVKWEEVWYAGGMKIGLVQSRAEAGDLSGNLRRVVQGVRAVMDDGAQVAVAGAAALDGVCYGEWPGGAESHRLQAQGALAALAEELSIPLVLACSAREPGESGEEVRPYLLDKGEVCLLPNRAVCRVGGRSVWVDVGEEPVPPGESCDVALHLPTTRWQRGRDWAVAACAEAAGGGHAVVIAQSVGCSEGKLQAGGCAAAAPGGNGMRLPDFAETECVWHPTTKWQAAPLATAAEALVFCLRETLSQCGASGYAVAADSPTTPLLCALVEKAIGKEKLALLPRQPETDCDALQARFCGAMLTTWAEDHDYVLLNPLTRSRLLLGDYTAPATLYGEIAPLGDFWESEIGDLQAELLPGKHSPATEDEALLRAMLAQSPLRYLDTPEEGSALRLHRRLCRAPRHSWPRVYQM